MPNHANRVAGIVLGALLALVTVEAQAAGEPYELYAMTSLTGPAAFLGRGEASTFAVAEKYVNATGGIKGQPLHIIVQDDGSNPATAVSLASQVFAKHVAATVGPGFGATGTALLPLVADGPVMYCLSNVIHPVSGTFAFSYAPAGTELWAAALRFLKARGVRKVGLLATTDASGQDSENTIEEDLKTAEFRDLQVVATEHMAVTDFTANAQLGRIKGAGAQVLFALVSGTPFGTVLRGVQEVGFDGVVATSGANLNKTQMEQYAAFIPRALLMIGQPYAAVASTVPPRVREAKRIFLEQMRQAGIPVPDATQWIAWDPTMIVVDALRHLGPQATAKTVRDYILQLHDFAGVNGLYDFRRGDQRGIDPQSSVVVRWDQSKDDFVTISKPGGLPL